MKFLVSSISDCIRPVVLRHFLRIIVARILIWVQNGELSRRLSMPTIRWWTSILLLSSGLVWGQSGQPKSRTPRKSLTPEHATSKQNLKTNFPISPYPSPHPHLHKPTPSHPHN